LPRLDAAQGHESLTVRQWNLNARDAEQYKQKQKERVGAVHTSNTMPSTCKISKRIQHISREAWLRKMHSEGGGTQSLNKPSHEHLKKGDTHEVKNTHITATSVLVPG
jgi:hypothetical protein